jgi:hypothetical protein
MGPRHECIETAIVYGRQTVFIRTNLRPTDVCWKEETRSVQIDAEHLVRTVLGFALAFIAACCYMKLLPSAAIVVAAALSARVASAIIGNTHR